MTTLKATWQTLRGNFSPLRSPNFRTYIGGQAISLIGTFLQITAQAWVVWQLTHSEAALGIATTLYALPLLLFSTYAGIWVDRLDRRKLLIGTQIGAMLLAFVLTALTQTGLVQVWHVYVLSFLLGTVNVLDFPAQQAFLGDLTGMAEVPKAVNLNSTIVTVSRVLGPALAGPVVARIGVAPAFWLNGLSFLAVIAILLNFFVFSIFLNILPAVAGKLLNGDAETLGALMASSGLGALIAVVVIVPLAQARKRAGIVMVTALFWLAFWLTILAQSRVVGLSMAAVFMANLAVTTVLTMSMGLVQVMSPVDMRGRLMSLFVTIGVGAQRPRRQQPQGRLVRGDRRQKHSGG